MLVQTEIDALDRTQVVNALAGIRIDWEEAAEGEDLVEVKGSVGLLLWDVVIALNLTHEDQASVLGTDLRKSVLQYLRTRTMLNSDGN